ncbi:hypothetical protein GC163_02795 [bacterium]|nr:hypothetical protein [bacterium]
MPAARVTFLALFVLLFAAAWSNDSGLQQVALADPLPRVVPITEPTEVRPRMADGHLRTSHSFRQVVRVSRSV